MSKPLDWKDVPCHFSWKIDRAAKQILRSVSEFGRESAEFSSNEENKCYVLLNLAYLEFLKGGGVNQDTVGNLDEADKLIDKMEDVSGKRAFQLVSLANRAWILSKAGENTVESVISSLLRKYEEHLSSKNIEQETAYLDAIEAFALRRVILNEKAEKKFKSAIEVIPHIAIWHYELGRAVGSNLKTAEEQTEAKIPHFQRALDLEPNYVQCMVKLVDCFNRAGNLEASKEMIARLEKHNISGNPKALCAKASFYIRSEKYDTALEILHEAERFNRADVYNLIATAYRLKAFEVSPLKRRKFLDDALTNVEKCLLKDPGSYDGNTNKFDILCGLKVSAEELQSFLRNICEKRPIPPSLVFRAFLKMMRIFRKVNKSNLHPDLGILLTLYESMVTMAEDECTESDTDGQDALHENNLETIKNAQTFVSEYLKEKGGREDVNERFREANERLRFYFESA